MSKIPLALPEVTVGNVDALFSANLPPNMVRNLPICELDAFIGHPFKVKNDESMRLLVESAQEFGIQTPAIVRPKEDGRYEIISGHRRKMACELAGLLDMPCIIREMTQDEAIIFMVDANLQREVILPSEKAKSYKMRLDAMKRQGLRTDLTSTPLVGKLKGKESAELLGETVGESREQVRRFIRLNELIPELLDMVDDNHIALRTAVELSYITQEGQETLHIVIESNGKYPMYEQSVKLRALSDGGELSESVVADILGEEKQSVGQFKIPRASLAKFFKPDTSPAEVQKTIVAALEYYINRAID